MIPCECVLLSHVNSLHFNQWVSLIIVNKHFLSSLKRLFIQTKLLLNYFYVLLGLSTYFTFSHHVLIVYTDSHKAAVSVPSCWWLSSTLRPVLNFSGFHQFVRDLIIQCYADSRKSSVFSIHSFICVDFLFFELCSLSADNPIKAD